nr:MAG TPA: hypothetical protein [Caudoviricetes sp.]
MFNIMILKYRKNYILKLFRQPGSPVPAHHCAGLFYVNLEYSFRWSLP